MAGSPVEDLEQMKQTGAEKRPHYLGYFLAAIVLFGCYVVINRFQEDNSATMAPNLTHVGR